MMKFVIKNRPEDFIVEELADLPFDPAGGYAVFRLTKRGWNTVDALKAAARATGFPFDAFSYGGKKDRHALTRQFVALRGGTADAMRVCSHSDDPRRGSGYSFEYVGRMAHPMSPRLIRGNSFIVVIRKLSAASAARAAARIDGVVARGYPNYFDDQRFGSYDTEQGFFGEKVLKKHFSGALKIHLTREVAGNAAGDRARKRFFFERWGAWEECYARAATQYEKAVFGYLRHNPKACEEVLCRIPREEITVYFSAYQSFLWNEMLRRLIAAVCPGPRAVYPGAAGEYLFPAQEGEGFSALNEVVLPLHGMKPVFGDGRARELYHEVMESRGIRQGMFNALRIRQAFFKSIPRSALVRPCDVSHESGPDTSNKDRAQLTIRFILPRGSYATLFLKRLFL